MYCDDEGRQLPVQSESHTACSRVCVSTAQVTDVATRIGVEFGHVYLTVVKERRIQVALVLHIAVVTRTCECQVSAGVLPWV